MGCNPTLGQTIYILGDSHHVKSAGNLAVHFLSRDAAPTLHLVGGYIGLRLTDPYILARLQKLNEAGRLADVDRVIIFGGTNDVGCVIFPENAACLTFMHPAWESVLADLKALLGNKLLLVGPSIDHEYSTQFYAAAAGLEIDTVDLRNYELSGDLVHLSDVGYNALGQDLSLRVLFQ